MVTRPRLLVLLVGVATLAAHPAAAQDVDDDTPRQEVHDPARLEAEPVDAPPRPDTPWEHWKAAKEDLRERYGTTLSINFDLVSRAALAGPEEDWKATSRYDVLLRQRVWEDALVSLHVRGGWGDGLDERIGLFANTQQYAVGYDAFVLHLYFQQQLLDEQLTVRFGKFDIGDWVDTNRFGFYNFLGYAFAHNAAVPLTGNTLGGMFTYEPAQVEWFYVTAGLSNAGQTAFETGFSSAFDDEDEWLSIGEVGFRTSFFDRDGVYRFLAWHNSADWTTPDATVDNSAVGAAISFDQNLTERLGVFFRLGVADGDPYEPKRSWSAGFLLDEPIPGRPKDSFAVGVILNEFTDGREALLDDATGTETYFEVYYNLHITEWMQLRPAIQVIDNPGGRDRDTAVLVGAHVALRF